MRDDVMMKLLTILIISFHTCLAVANDLLAGDTFRININTLEELTDEDLAVVKAHKFDGQYGAYVAPNELQPKEMLPLVADVPVGSLVSVGTQRCLMAGAKLSQIAKVHCYDISHGVLVFNLINAKLIAIAKNRQDFLDLANKASLQDWRERLSQLHFKDDTMQDLFEFWRYHFRSNPMNQLFARPPTSVFFDEMNYGYDDALFTRLQKMILAHDVTFDWIDLTSSNGISALVKSMRRNGEILSILDLSNVPEYTMFTPLTPALVAFAKISTPDTVILQTTENGSGLWFYSAFKMTEQNLEKLKTYDDQKQRGLGAVWDLKINPEFLHLFSVQSAGGLCRTPECQASQAECKRVDQDQRHYIGE
jgi:hypothetical protein